MFARTAGFAVIALTFCVCIAGIADAAPRISVEQPVFDFGQVRQGRRVDHTFVIHNRGDAPLLIERTRSSCGCTVANVNSRTIAVGGSSEIKVSFDSSNFGGKIEKTVSIDANDPKSPTTTLTIKGIVTEELVITPRQINLGSVKSGTTKDATVTIENRGDRPVRLTNISSTTPQLVVKGNPLSLKAGGKTSIVVSASPRTEDRYLSGNIIIATDNKAKPNLVIPVYGSVIN